LAEVLKWLGDGKMTISGDMPHAEARDNSITEIKERNDINETQKKKILGANAKRFFRTVNRDVDLRSRLAGQPA